MKTLLTTPLTVTKKIKKKKMKKFNCNEATYKTVTLFDFVYKHKCFPAGWKVFLNQAKNVITEISNELQKKAAGNVKIEPPMRNMFKAFNVRVGRPRIDLVQGRDAVKVVILGQDPVPTANQATGLAFSLNPFANPRDSVPSVFNMLVELKLEGMNVDLSNGDLSPWVNRGVLLLNAALTVLQGTSKDNAKAHQQMWSKFTKLLVKHINNNVWYTAWILLGKEAKAFAVWINTTNEKHFIKAGGHPSPRGKKAGIRFFGRNYFSCANEFLKEKGRGEVDWTLPARIVFGKQPGDCNANGLP